MGTLSKVVVAAFTVVLLLLHGGLTTATWCVARSDATQEALQIALDYACSAGADCAPLQLSGLCFLPNTIQAHASYAFNSYYMRKSMAPGSCDFSGTATVAKTDPSYGSCVYPPSPSTAGGTTPITTPVSGTVPPPPFGGGLTPIGNGMVPTLSSPPISKAFREYSVSRITVVVLIFQSIQILSA
ncbi:PLASMODESMATA CALLOSE-BINDING PROTEIN 3-like [Cynara cardunculus var. scolymus]|uniref:X8-like protein n=1 Tax=Cynara cardunculus var. scolymus TaxID=59895 RepID=A0A103XHX3_CYNCS|nr:PLASMODESMATA CALLOSE-BINDING PROTEIN 3-like [Cynara cardunculus var. scolymus]KVH90968.1 X8-like protein [Cynara cardunculus var. scolymus]